MSGAAAVVARVRAYDWAQVGDSLDRSGWARLPRLLTAAECRGLRALYDDRARYRSFVDLGAKRYGDNGDYRYFAYPLPPLVRTLRTHLYAPLARIANRWQGELGRDERFPGGLRTYLRACHDAGQTRPTPLLLRYRKDGYNCLHQDLYGAMAFPLQVAVLLSKPSSDFTGGEFLLTEQRPRMQARGEALSLALGEGLVFPNRERPVEGRRGHHAAAMRHGVSRVRSGHRMTLGLIFHDAK